MADPSVINFELNVPLGYSQQDDQGIFEQDDEGRKSVTLDKIFDTKYPHKTEKEFMESKVVTDLADDCPLLESLPIDDDPRKNLASLQVNLYHTESKLSSIRRKMETGKVEMLKQWKDLQEKEKQLRKNFISFNQVLSILKFVIENKEKKERASKKLEDENQLIKTRSSDIKNLEAEIKQMMKVCKLMDVNIKRLSCYQTFLENVVETSEDFKTINDIIIRFASLVQQKKLLSQRQKDNMQTLQNAQNLMMKLIEEKNFVIMGLNNQIANLQARYENANIKALESEELVTQIKNNAVKQLGEIDTVKNSIWNIYVHMASSKKHPIKIKKDNVEEQMMYINRTLTELNKVNKLIKKRSGKTAKT